MSSAAASMHGKVVDLEGVFFGFSLHHLFMHMNRFCTIRLCTGFGALHVVIFGVPQCSHTRSMSREEGRGAVGRALAHAPAPQLHHEKLNCERSRVRVNQKVVSRE